MSDDYPDDRNQAAFQKWLNKNARDQNWDNPFDTGHEFETKKYEIVDYYDNLPFISSQHGHVGSGPIIPDPYGSSWGTFIDPPIADLGYYGPVAIERTRPTNPYENLSVALAELYREGIPEMGRSFQPRASAALSAKRSGQDWLAINFGWNPLLQDLAKTAKALAKHRQIISQFERDAGRLVRRTYRFPVQTDTKLLGKESGYLFRPSNTTEWDWCMKNRSLDGTVTHLQKTTNRVWFSGAYSYATSVDKTFIGKLKRWERDMNHVLGTRLTPEVLWNLAPWSWLSDWTNSFGSTIANASAFQDDGLVLRYGYLMNESIRDHTMMISGPELYSGPSGPYIVTYRTTRKRRRKATPYGFGLRPDQFTDQQWSILGALGLSGGPGHLRGR